MAYKPGFFQHFALWTASLWFLLHFFDILPSSIFVLLTVTLGSWVCYFLTFILCKTLLRRRFSVLKDIPGPPPGNILYDHAFDIFEEPLGAKVTEWVNAIPHDGLLHFHGLLGSEYLIPTSPEGLVEVLSTRAYDFEKTRGFHRYVDRFFGKGLVTQEQEEHKKHRRTFLPIYNQSAVDRMKPTLVKKGRQFVQEVERRCVCGADGRESAVVNITEVIGMVSLDIVSITAMGIDFETILGRNREVFDAYEAIFASDSHKMARFMWHNVVPPWLVRLVPDEGDRRMDETRDLLVRIIREAIEQRRLLLEKTEGKDEGEAGERDFLSNLIASKSFDEEEAIPQIFTILAAGYESTGGTLSWVIYALATHPDIQTALREELSTVRHDKETLSDDDYEALPLLNALINETTRFYPSFSLLLRKAIRNTTISNRFVPAGTYIGICPKAINHAHHLWGPDATTFNPERWIDRSDPAQPKINAHGGAPSAICMLSFFYGARSCVGRGLALAQMRRQIALIVERFGIEVVDEKVPRQTGFIATTPSLDLRMKFVRIA